MIGLMLVSLAQSTVASQLVHDGGVCAGLSWVRLAPSEHAAVESGPDFNVYRFNGPAGEDDHWWGLYSGRYANAKAEGRNLLEHDGVTVKRAVKDGKFSGYLAEKEGRQNHFFGSIFSDSSADLSFFARIDFGTTGQTLCAKPG
jgi:hypothetical protein